MRKKPTPSGKRKDKALTITDLRRQARAELPKLLEDTKPTAFHYQLDGSLQIETGGNIVMTIPLPEINQAAPEHCRIIEELVAMFQDKEAIARRAVAIANLKQGKHDGIRSADHKKTELSKRDKVLADRACTLLRKNSRLTWADIARRIRERFDDEDRDADWLRRKLARMHRSGVLSKS